MLTCIALDDEPLALLVLEKYIGKIYFLDCKRFFTDAEEAREFLQSTAVDIIFLDIQMPDVNGIEFSKSLVLKRTAVIFTTAFDEYAIDGFNVDAVDYLLKPIAYDRFLKAVNKAKEYLEYLGSQELEHGYIFVKSDYQMMKIFLRDIVYIEALDDYIKIFLGQRSVLTLMTLKAITQKLPSKEFLRVHRSYIVPVNKIDHISRSRIRVADKDIPIGISYSESFFKAMKQRLQ
jgi:DNA-binding LytR/AlgR family response regulator